MHSGNLMASPVAHHTQALRRKRQDVSAALRRTCARMDAELARILNPTGISVQQYRVLRIVRDAGEAGIPTLAIAGMLVDRAPGVTRLVDRLEGQGLALRERGEDRRKRICHITPRGSDLIASLETQVNATYEAMLTSLTENEMGVLIHLLQRIRTRATS